MSGTEREIIKSVVIDADPSVVFRAITDEKELPYWFPNAGAQLEPRVGGIVILKTRRPDSAIVHTTVGRIVEFVPNEKFSHTWSAKEAPNGAESVVTWTLEPLGSHRTKVTLVHSGQTRDKFDDTDRGWSYFTGRLAEHCKQKSSTAATNP